MGRFFKTGVCVLTMFSLSLFLSAAPPSQGNNMLQNGDFSQGTQGWNFWTHPGTTGEFTVQNGAAEFRIDTLGSPWSIGCLHPDLRIEYGRSYEASFEAKADQTFTLISQVQLGKEPWTAYSKMRSFPLSQKMTKYTYTFTMTNPTDEAAMFQFLFTAPGRVTLAHVTLKDVTQKPLETALLGLEDRKLDTDIDRLTVYVYGQQTLKENNPWIYEVKADINDRSVIKWGTNGNHPEDYNFDAVKASHHAGILYMGGMTTVIQKQEFKDEAQFRDMATRDANGELVPWADQGLRNRARPIPRGAGQSPLPQIHHRHLQDPDRRRRRRHPLRRAQLVLPGRPPAELDQQRGVRRLLDRRFQPLPPGQIPPLQKGRLEKGIPNEGRQPPQKECPAG